MLQKKWKSKSSGGHAQTNIKLLQTSRNEETLFVIGFIDKGMQISKKKKIDKTL